jgi:hypothetical protein
MPSSSLAIGVCLMAAAWLWTPQGGNGGGEKVPSAQSIIDKAIEFHGGRKALDRDVAITRSEESEMMFEGQKIPMKCDWQYQPPDKRAFQALVKIGGLQLHVQGALDGLKGWMKVGPALAADLSPKQAAGLLFEQMNHVRSVQLLTSAADNFDLGAPKAGRFADRDAWQFTCLSKKTKHELTVFFDKKTGQILGDESERVLPTLGADETREKPATYRVVYKSLVDVDGMKMPETMTILRDGVPVIEVRKAQVRIVDSVDPKLFVKP